MTSATAEKLKFKLELPTFESTPREIQKTVDQRIVVSKKWVEQIRSQNEDHVTFESTVQALDDLDFEESSIMSRISILMNTSPEEALRKACEKAHLQFQDWAIERSFDQKVYAVCAAYEKTNPCLEGEKKKLLEDTLTDFRRNGLHLEETKQTQLKNLFKEVSQLETKFHSHINEYQDELWVKETDLKGLEQSFIESLEKNKEGLFKLTLDYPLYFPILDQCESEDIRKSLFIKKQNTAAPENTKILTNLIRKRDQIAKLLGFSSWNHYIIDYKMAKTPERVESFLMNLIQKLKPKGNKELEELKTLKRRFTGKKDADFHLWDYRYYTRKLMEEKYQIDTNEVKKYFPYEQTLRGMFDVYSKIFGVTFQEEPEGSYYQWHPEVKLYRCQDQSGAPLGLFFLDMHPRPGKYGHACVMGMVAGKLQRTGYYQRPIATMICNFPKGTSHQPSLLPHDQVETLFHEFGHILHQILTTSHYSMFSGTSVKRDFVEAPSQVLENWVWDHDVLKTFAKHFKDPTKEIPLELVQKMNQAKRAGAALFYLRQLSLALCDLRLHAEGENKEVDAICNQTTAEVFLPQPEGTHFPAGWGHMVGYAAGYYGYAWADVMAADMYTIFKKTGPFDQESGRRLRQEIFEPGGSRDENESLEAFLQRPLSNQAFLEEIGAA